MRRVIAACHRHKIQVVPTSPARVPSRAQGYPEHEADWNAASISCTVFHNSRQGEFGAQMCPQSGWLDRERATSKGIPRTGLRWNLLRLVMTLPCDNKNHNARLHLGTDGVIDILAWTAGCWPQTTGP